MKLFIQAKPNTKEERMEQIDQTKFIVAVKEPPVQGRANAAIQKALAEHFGVALGRMRLVSGYSSKQKMFEII